jgi:hypothetical protein
MDYRDWIMIVIVGLIITLARREKITCENVVGTGCLVTGILGAIIYVIKWLAK